MALPPLTLTLQHLYHSSINPANHIPKLNQHSTCTVFTRYCPEPSKDKPNHLIKTEFFIIKLPGRFNDVIKSCHDNTLVMNKNKVSLHKYYKTKIMTML